MAEPAKKSVRLSADTVAIINEVSYPRTNWSGAINSITSRYKLLVDANTPKLSKQQMLAISQAYNGKLIELQNFEREAEILPWQIDQAIQYDSNVVELLAKEHEMSIEGYMQSEQLQQFISKVKSWNISQKIAVLHNALAFWASEADDDA